MDAPTNNNRPVLPPMNRSSTDWEAMTSILLPVLGTHQLMPPESRLLHDVTKELLLSTVLDPVATFDYGPDYYIMMEDNVLVPATHSSSAAVRSAVDDMTTSSSFLGFLPVPGDRETNTIKKKSKLRSLLKLVSDTKKKCPSILIVLLIVLLLLHGLSSIVFSFL